MNQHQNHVIKVWGSKCRCYNEDYTDYEIHEFNGQSDSCNFDLAACLLLTEDDNRYKILQSFKSRKDAIEYIQSIDILYIKSTMSCKWILWKNSIRILSYLRISVIYFIFIININICSCAYIIYKSSMHTIINHWTTHQWYIIIYYDFIPTNAIAIFFVFIFLFYFISKLY